MRYIFFLLFLFFIPISWIHAQQTGNNSGSLFGTSPNTSNSGGNSQVLRKSSDYRISIARAALRIPFSGSSYNKFLKRYYDQDSGNFAGFELKLDLFNNIFFQSNQEAIIFNYRNLDYAFQYETLNGNKKENFANITTYGVGYAFFFLMGKNFNHELFLGFGILNLKREFFGYNSTLITVQNIQESNRRSNSSKSTSYIRYGYTLSYLFNSTFSLQLGIGYLSSSVKITADDQPPGIDEKGVIGSMIFDLSGLDLKIGVGAKF